MFREVVSKEILQVPGKALINEPRENALKILRSLFRNVYKYSFLGDIYIPTSKKIKKGHFLGKIELSDGILPVFIFEHTGTVNAKNQLLTELPKILRNLNKSRLGLDHSFIEHAIVFFIPKSDPNEQWKLSLVSSLKHNALIYKRHSYILGPGANIRVPQEYLIQKLSTWIDSGSLTIKQLKDVFEPEPLTKAFYKDLIHWFYWAMEYIDFPKGDGTKDNTKINQEALVRFITRILFVWFLKQKKLVPDALFNQEYLQNILRVEHNLKDSKDTIYYRAILQNLFFATLSTPVNSRRFRDEQRHLRGHNNDFGNQYVYRFKNYFKINEQDIKKLFQQIPFLNGGLFESLDKSYKEGSKRKDIYYDGFTERKRFQPIFPDFLFFAPEHTEKLKFLNNKSSYVSGLLEILNRYHFTVTEDTPLDKNVALDPELLGNIFENLLAEQLDETAQNARKVTGSFYTPHEVVDFMVEESLREYLKTHLQGNKQEIEKYLNVLFNQTTTESDLKSYERLNQQTLKLFSTIKIIDPAVGSGAFPMGILNKMVFLLQKLDLDNKKWLQEQLEKIDQLDLPYSIKEKQKKDLLETFESKGETDYFRKLYLIRDSIYGVDIQPIAIQIARLRFFLSLIIEEEPKFSKPNNNFGIQPLPNLYMNLVIANSLVPLDYTMSKENPLKGNSNQLQMNIDSKIENIKQRLINVTKQLFWVSDPNLREELKEKEKQLRLEFAEALKGNFNKDYERIINWDPYNPHKSADWFDPLFMLRVDDGFDVVIANPPYVRQEKIRDQKPLLKRIYSVYNSTSDLYTYFYERGYQLLKEQGVLTFISSNKFLRAKYGQKLREFLQENMTLKHLTDFRGYQVFTSATVDTLILVASKQRPNNNSFKVCLIDNEFNHVKKLKEFCNTKGFDFKQNRLLPDVWVFEDIDIKEKIEKVGVPLKDWNINIYRGILTGYNKAFIIDSQTREEILNNCRTEEERKRTEELIKPVLRGRDIKRYYYKWAGLWVIVIPAGWTNKNRGDQDPEKFFKATLPALYEHFMNIAKEERTTGRRKGLFNRDDQGDYWWELRHCDYYQEFEKEKIVWNRIASELRFAYIPPDYYILDSMFFITGKNIKYLISILNSTVASFWIRQNTASLGEGTYGAGFYIERLPIPLIPQNQRGIFTSHIDKILSITNHPDYEQRPDLQEKVEEYSKQVDQLVYKLYGLTEEEIRRVEEKVR